MKYLLVLVCLVNTVFAQTYHPAAGKPGTSAMEKDSSAFIAWATACTVQRGLQDISDPNSGLASVGVVNAVQGKSDGAVLSLGDGGFATCTFLKPISNGPGNDFAVFENAIDDSFLELAFVEVSSDGTNFFRFPAHSLTDTLTQTSSFGSTDPTRINNLAGKYRSGFGTPFDLQELQNKLGLNIEAVTHVRIVDVVGTMQNQYATRDSKGNKVNDPWPTAFSSGGFDLDAIGVIHQSDVSSVDENNFSGPFVLFPNPAQPGQPIYVNGLKDAGLFSVGGKYIKPIDGQINTQDLLPGVYVVKGSIAGRPAYQKLIISNN